ncbi:MAG TPA: hypothetical protein VMV73_06615, partial [Candidatus Dormibacteraeota bacterium]|nr:hypothetical protein [Candidatus Dormibacteraeota bacterium]
MVIEKASIVDGSGVGRFTTDLALSGERIARIGDCSGLEAQHRIDGRALVLAPGFINVHAHSGQRCFDARSSASSSAQGITTAIEGACARTLPLEQASSLRGSLALNLALLAPPEPEALERGAVGASIALDRSDPAAILAALGRRRGGELPLVVHLRNEGAALLESLDEALALAGSLDLPLHLSHLKFAYGRDRAIVHEALERIDRARSRGGRITCDCYPYIATNGTLGALFPRGVAQAERSDEKAIAAMLALRLAHHDHWESISLRSVRDERSIEDLGVGIATIAARRRLSPERTAIALLEEHGPDARLLHRCLHEDDVATILSAPFT